MNVPAEGAPKEWTCSRCAVTARFTADAQQFELPANWIDEDAGIYCLACRRELAAEAGAAGSSADSTKAGRAQMRSAALVEFEINRDPSRPNAEIARACRASVTSVVKARERLGVDDAG